MGNSPRKTLMGVAILATTLAVPIVAQSSVAAAQPIGATYASSQSSTYPAPTLNPASVTAGAGTTVSGAQCDPSYGPTNVFVSLVDSSGNVLSSTSLPPNPNGTWQVVVTVPPGAPSGTYGVYSTCDMYYTEFFYPPVSLAVTAASASPWTVQNAINQKGPTGTVNGISCLATNACTAVGTYVNSGGQTVPMAESWNGAKWIGSALPVLTGQKAYGMNAVSCPVTNSCTAVGNYVNSSGRQLTFAETWNGTSWAIHAPANPAGGSVDVLSAVSCTTSSACTAVGSYRTYVNGQLQTVGFSEVWNGAIWSLQSVPEPAASAAFALASVSCSALSSCIAIGWYTTSPYAYYGSYGSVPLAEQWNGTAWSALSLASPADAYSFGESVTSVSCSAPTACTAVGSYYSSSNGLTPLIERWDGTTWAIQAALRPVGGYSPTFTSVACVSSSACEAVGSYESTTGVVALAETWNGSAWGEQAVPSPTSATNASLTALSCSSASACSATGSYGTTGPYSYGLQQDWAANLAAGAWTVKSISSLAGTGFDQLQSVSCSATTACTAVGGAENSKGQEVALTEAWNGAGWTVQSVPSPKGSTGDWLSGVSCTAVNACVAVGSSHTAASMQTALIEMWDGTSWSIQPAPMPSASFSSGLGSVSCSAANACTAIGSFTSSVTYKTAFLAESWNGSTWTASALPTPADFYYGQLSSISCSAVDACVAVGSYVNQSYTSQALVETWNGATWTPQTLGNVPQQGATLNSVSCASSNSCVAVGSDYGSSYGGQAPLAEVWNGTTWTAESAAGGGRGAALSGISCTSATTCTAVGTASVYGYPNQVPLAETWNGTTWTEQPMPKIPNAAAGYLNSVSCVVASACATVGSRNLGSNATLAEGEGGA